MTTRSASREKIEVDTKETNKTKTKALDLSEGFINIPRNGWWRRSLDAIRDINAHGLRQFIEDEIGSTCSAQENDLEPGSPTV